jgi:hypothetical protein
LIDRLVRFHPEATLFAMCLEDLALLYFYWLEAAATWCMMMVTIWPLQMTTKQKWFLKVILVAN